MGAQDIDDFALEKRWAEWNNRLSGKRQGKTAYGMIEGQETDTDMSYADQSLGNHIEPLSLSITEAKKVNVMITCRRLKATER